MPEENPYKIAYEREKIARQEAEKLLDEKSISLFENFTQLESTLKELKKTQRKLVQSEKLASIGQLAAGVAHEINNPIGYCLSNLEVLKDYAKTIVAYNNEIENIFSYAPENQKLMELKENLDYEHIMGDLNDLVSESAMGLHRIGEIVHNLKKVSYSGELNIQPCDINSLIDESIKVVWNEIKYSMEVKKQYSDISLIEVHANEIHQVLINLFINACHACEDKNSDSKGLLMIQTSVVNIEESKWVEINISDNGKGISEEIIQKIFDPFFTTKSIGIGTGLGLSISFGIIEKHGGKLSVNSTVNVGTTFTIQLPIKE